MQMHVCDDKYAMEQCPTTYTCHTVVLQKSCSHGNHGFAKCTASCAALAVYSNDSVAMCAARFAVLAVHNPAATKTMAATRSQVCKRKVNSPKNVKYTKVTNVYSRNQKNLPESNTTAQQVSHTVCVPQNFKTRAAR